MSTPDSNQKDQDWVPRSRALLDHHAEQLDPISARQLSRARQRALASVRRAPLMRWAIGLGAATAASLIVFVMLNRTPEPSSAPLTRIDTPTPVPVTATTPTTPTTPITQALALPDDELELIANPDDFALLQDLEFYAWLESAEHGG